METLEALVILPQQIPHKEIQEELQPLLLLLLQSMQVVVVAELLLLVIMHQIILEELVEQVHLIQF
tara:strand:+ start:89 stop:286 length:198 start_codon:yes stop_codon:yes gene_type:complete